MYFAELLRRETLLANGNDVGVDLKNAHDIQARVGVPFGVTGRTISNWAQQYMKNGTFKLDSRGQSASTSLIHEEEVNIAVRVWMQAQLNNKGRDQLSVDNTWKWIKTTLLPGLDATLKQQYGIANDSVSRDTARRWMHAAGAETAWHKKVQQ